MSTPIPAHARALALSSVRGALALSWLVFLGACGDDSAQVPSRAADPIAQTSTGVPPVDPATVPPSPAVPTQGMAIGPQMNAADLVRAMLSLVQATERTGLQATSTDGLMFQIVLSPETDATRASALSRALGNVTTNPIVWPPAAPTFALEVENVHGGTTLHLAPNSTAETIASLPDGTLFVAFLGTFAGGVSSRAGDAAWAFGQDSSGRVGWVRGAAIGPEEGCVLGRDALAGALGVRLDDEQLRLGVLGNMHLYRGGQRKRGSFFIAPTFVALLERPSNCRDARLDTKIPVDGPVEELHYARVSETGDTFVAIALEGESGSGQTAWGFYPPTATEPAVSLSLETHWTTPSRRRAQVHIAPRRGPANARGYWPFSVKNPGADAVFYVSDGTTFTEFSTEPPAPPVEPAP